MELCLIIRNNRTFLFAEDVRECCNFIASLYMVAGCKNASDLCRKAAETVMKDEEHHLKLCSQSCALCRDGGFPAEPLVERATYVA